MIVRTLLSWRSGASAAETADSKVGLPTVSEGLPSTSSNPLAIEVGSCCDSRVRARLDSKWKVLLLFSVPPRLSRPRLATKRASDASSTHHRCR